MQVQNLLQLVFRRLLLLPYDVSKVERVFPEDEDEDDLEDERDVRNQADKSSQLVLIASVFFVFFTRARVNHEKLDKVIDPAHNDQQDETAERLSGDGCGVLDDVQGDDSDGQTQEAVTLEHLEEH